MTIPMTEEKLLTLFERALTGGDDTAMEELKDRYWEDFDTEELAFRAACRTGDCGYVEEFAPEMDLNTDGGFCPYLDEARNDAVRGLLKRAGARERASRAGQSESIRLGSGGVVEFMTPQLHRRLLEACLKRAGLTVKALELALSARRAASLPIPNPEPPFAPGDTLATLCDAFLVTMKKGVLCCGGVDRPTDAPRLAAFAREVLPTLR